MGSEQTLASARSSSTVSAWSEFLVKQSFTARRATGSSPITSIRGLAIWVIEEVWDLRLGRTWAAVQSNLHRFYGIAVDVDRQGTLNWVDRDYQPVCSIARQQYTLYPIQRSAPNANMLSDFQKWIKSVWRHALQKSTNILNFYIRDRNCPTTETYKAQNSIG